MENSLVSLQNISKSFGDNLILNNINLEIKKSEFITLLGPSGCGKTTILRLLAGFESLSHGDIILDGKNINNLEAEKRAVNTIFQSYALFPHMSVFDNVAFGLKMKKFPKDKIEEEVSSILSLVKLFEHKNKFPNQLSGGQQQRVAIARAIVNKPKLLLLDESLSALDYKLRKEMQIELKMLQRKLGITFLFVTHDQEEALSMSDRIVVLNKGQIEQIGTPKEIYEEPKTLFVAQFIGEANCFEAEVLSKENDHITLKYKDKTFHLKTKKDIKESCTILIRPEDFRVERKLKNVHSKNYFLGNLEEIIYKGTTIDLLITLEDGKKIIVSEFYNEDSDALEYQVNSELYIYWVDGWEVLLVND